MKTDLSDCVLCSPGMFCSESGLSEPNGECDEGFYCVKGSDTARPPDVRKCCILLFVKTKYAEHRHS